MKASTARAPAAVKRQRLSIIRKTPKDLVNPLPQPLKLQGSSGQRLAFDWPLASQTDLSQNGQRLSVFVVGAGDMGQLGMGTDMTDEFRRPRLHPAFEPASANGNGAADGQEDVDGESQAKSPQPKLGQFTPVDVACGGMHSLVVDSNGQVCLVCFFRSAARE